MNLSTTIQNQLNGLTEGFQNIMSGVISAATSAVASLPGLIIQRASPDLYNLITNGILQARLDFDRSKATCRAMAEQMADIVGGQSGWGQVADAMALRSSVTTQGGDAVSAVKQAEETHGDNGVPWVGGQNAGGAGQDAIQITGGTTKAAYNLTNSRGVTDTSTIDTASCATVLCQMWDSPQAMADWATRVLGEEEQRTCETCTKTVTTPGVGLTPMIQKAYDDKLPVLQGLVDGSRAMSVEALNEGGSSSLPVTRSVIEALRDEPDRNFLIQRLASEIAFADVMEKALLLQRALYTGQKEPNIASNKLAVEAVTRQSDALNREIMSLKAEMEVRRELANNSAMAIIERDSARARSANRTNDRETMTNRFDRLDRAEPTAGTTP
jgi:integrating conjugative element protein (TIGR03755 family)